MVHKLFDSKQLGLVFILFCFHLWSSAALQKMTLTILTLLLQIRRA